MRPIDTILAEIATIPTAQTSLGDGQQAILVAANSMVKRASGEPLLRELAAAITAKLVSVPSQGAYCIACWVRRTIRYVKESADEEVLQGPFSTLKTRIGDCDDSSILWATLCRAIGIDAGVAGLGPSADEMCHAVGMDLATGRLYELSVDRQWAQGQPVSSSPDDLLLPAGSWTLQYVVDGEIQRSTIVVEPRAVDAPIALVGFLGGAATLAASYHQDDTIGDMVGKFAVGAGIGALVTMIGADRPRQAK